MCRRPYLIIVYVNKSLRKSLCWDQSFIMPSKKHINALVISSLPRFGLLMFFEENAQVAWKTVKVVHET